jgi:type I restriction enzyme, S subunit
MRRTRVGDLIELQRRKIEVDPLEIYEQIGVRSFGKGIFHKEAVSGADLGAKRVFEVRPGDLVLNNVFAWEGAVALAGADEDGKCGSHRFLTYTARDRTLDLSFLLYFFLSEPGLARLRAASPGSAGRNRTLAIDRFENLEVPLPSADEQRRTVARLQAAFAHISAGDDMLSRSARLSNALPVAAAHREDISTGEKGAQGWSRITLRDVMTLELDEFAVNLAESYPNVGILSFGRGLFEKEPIEGAATSAKKLYRIREEQFIYSRLFAFEGAYAVVDEGFDGRYVSNEFPTFAVDNARIDPAFLAAYFRSPTVWRDLAGRSKGLGVRRQRVQPDAILEYEIWLPPIEEQRRVARTMALVGASDVTRSRMKARLNALGAAALNQAFDALS